MSNLASFSFGTIVIGILVAVIAAILLLLLPFFFHKNRRFSALSYLCAMLFAVCLCICNIYFCGLVKGKSILSDYEQSAQYRLLQQSGDLVRSYSSDLYDLAASFYGVDVSEESIEEQYREINTHLWIWGCVAAVLFVLGLFAVSATMVRCCQTPDRTVRRVPSHDNF